MITLTHQFQSAKADGPDRTQVQPSNWNANHVLNMATARLVGRTTAGVGAAEEIALGNGLMFSGSTLALATNPIVAGNITVSGNSVLSGTLSVTGATGVGGNAAPSAQLDVQSVTKGVLFPRMTTAQRDAIGAPAAGLVIYNTTASRMEVYSGGAWNVVGTFVGVGGAQAYSTRLTSIDATGLVTADIDPTALVTAAETIAANDVDTAVPSASAVFRGRAITWLAPQSTASGTDFDFTGIPSWVTEIYVLIDRYRVSSGIQGVQMRVSGAAVTTGYLSTSSTVDAGNAGTNSSTTNFTLFGASSVSGIICEMVIRKWPTSNLWVSTHQGHRRGTNDGSIFGGGDVTLAGAPDGIRVGSGTANQGSIVVGYR